jgi:hypothetical protein
MAAQLMRRACMPFRMLSFTEARDMPALSAISVCVRQAR